MTVMVLLVRVVGFDWKLTVFLIMEELRPKLEMEFRLKIMTRHEAHPVVGLR